MMGRVRRIWYLLNMPCKDVAERVARDIDAPLAGFERFAVELHLLYCSACRRFRRQLNLLLRILRGLGQMITRPDATPPMSLSPEAKERLRSALRRP